MSDIAVLGAGAFGTALAISFATSGHDVTLWCRDPLHAKAICADRENKARLPGAEIPDRVTLTSEFDRVRSDTVLLAVPAQQLRGFLTDHGDELDRRTLISCAKGIDQATFRRPTETIQAACPNARVAVLTGPSFAEDIAHGLPTALTLATLQGGSALQERLSGASLRIYLTSDVVGAELGGALKNVIALAAGLTIGAGLGESARAAAITRGFAEMARFAGTRGARPETLSGLSGLGDLILTCTSAKSRNYSAGLAIGAGQAIPEGKTIEGLATAKAVSNLAKIDGIDMPMTQMVAAVSSESLSVSDAAQILMSRPLRKE